MRCFSKRFSSWLFFLPLVFLSFLLLTILNTTDVFAESWTHTWTNSISSVSVPSTSSDSTAVGTFCGYKYILIESSNYYTGINVSGGVNGGTSNSWTYTLQSSYLSPRIVYFDFGTTPFSSYYFTSCRINPASYSPSITITLSDVPLFSSPSGSISLTENGTFDVSSYAEAVVDVPPVMGDYHNDLVDIKRSIYVGSATLLVIYFFYCIYRMIIKGVKK